MVSAHCEGHDCPVDRWSDAIVPVSGETCVDSNNDIIYYFKNLVCKYTDIDKCGVYTCICIHILYRF